MPAPLTELAPRDRHRKGVTTEKTIDLRLARHNPCNSRLPLRGFFRLGSSRLLRPVHSERTGGNLSQLASGPDRTHGPPPRPRPTRYLFFPRPVQTESKTPYIVLIAWTDPNHNLATATSPREASWKLGLLPAKNGTSSEQPTPRVAENCGRSTHLSRVRRHVPSPGNRMRATAAPVACKVSGFEDLAQ